MLIALFLAVFACSATLAQEPVPVAASPAVSVAWRAAWITHPEAEPNEQGVFHFRRDFDLTAVPDTFVVHVSGDNRFRLFVNGVSIASGPAASDPAHWSFQSVDLASHLRAGRNSVTAIVWNWGEAARPLARMSLRTGFLLQGAGDAGAVIDTGPGWKVLWNRGHRFEPVDMEKLQAYYVAGSSEVIDGALMPWDWQEQDFAQAPFVDAAFALPSPAPAAARGSNPFGMITSWQLEPRTIPAMEELPTRFIAVRRADGITVDPAFPAGGADIVVPPNTKATILLDQGQLVSAYPRLRASGGKGAQLQLTYAEALYDAAGKKGNRGEIEGKAIRGLTDLIRFDGGAGRVYETLWWRSWRYVQLDIRTGDDALVLHDLSATYTAYPLRQNARFASDFAWIDEVWEINWRILRLSAFDTFMDTPYYEQLQYVGDTRIEALITLYNSGDDRLVRNAITLFDQSRTPEGLTASRYPSAVPQYIPPFSLWWVMMVHDYAMHRDDPAFIAGFVPGTRGVLSYFERHIDPANGMLGAMPWWNFLDWNPAWERGTPPGSAKGNSTALTMQYAYTLTRAAELEERYGLPAMAARYREIAAALIAAARAQTWDRQRGLFADSPARTSFSQHANALAVLAGAFSPDDARAVMERVLAGEDMFEASFYFRFYVDEAMRQAGLADHYLERLEPWRTMLSLGLTTTPEAPDPSRSDSHAWSAHPNYHLLATVLGVRPAAPGFASIKIAPALGPLRLASGTVPHPAGPITVILERKGEQGLSARINLPARVPGLLVWHGETRKLHGGENFVNIDPE